MAILSTLAGQKSFRGCQGQDVTDLPKIEPPMAVLSVSGIYDFPILHDSFNSYIELTMNAIPDPGDNVASSPARYSAKEYVDIWAGGTGTGVEGGKAKKRALILAHSRDDGWVDWKQVETMQKVFAAEEWTPERIDVRILEMSGKHNEIWEKGTELARVIRASIGVVRELEAE